MLTRCKNGGRCHLGFLHYLNFDAKSPVGPHFQPLFQIWCKSVHKWRSYGRLTDFKMVAGAILNLLPVSILSLGRLWIVAGDVL